MNSKEDDALQGKKESRRMTSIARKINFIFWLKLFRVVIITDIVIAASGCGAMWYFRWNQMLLPENGITAAFVWDTTLNYAAQIWNEGYMFLIPLLSVQGVILLAAMFNTGVIRIRLKPLNDLAIKAEQMSRISFDPGVFDHLEQAIESLSPDRPEDGIHTGDKDLQSIEVALNNLLRHMKDSQIQQARFVSDASHELRTPVAVIQGYVNMLDRWGKTDKDVLNESIEAIKNESQHMKELIEQLLFLARGDSGKNILNMTKLDLNEIVREVCEESEMIDSRHVFTMKEADDAVMVGDKAMVKQSVRIFVQNAAKYSPEGSEIEMKVSSDDRYVYYSIQDEGSGMDAQAVPHIFERFYRADEARNTDTGGSGLGLSIAKWIVDAHDGVIEVLSRPEIGSRFTVRWNK